jgi:hypothetical protein
MCYGVSLSEADRVSRPDADYQAPTDCDRLYLDWDDE